MISLKVKPKSVLFVCLGNICRSPTAHAVFENMLQEAGLKNLVLVDSAGTGAYHVGNKPDNRMMKAAKQRGVDLSYLRARAVHESDFEKFDLILAMDELNYDDLIESCPIEYQDNVRLFLSFSDNASLKSVPDPYYGGQKGFEDVLDLVEEACSRLLKCFL